MVACEEPVNLRQLAQWQVWPMGWEKRLGWARVRAMELQRQEPVMLSEKDSGGWDLGSPVRFGIVG